MRANGTGLHVLASSRPGDTTPSWSPDGRRLVVRGFGLARSFDLYTIAVTGTARARLLATPRERALSELVERRAHDRLPERPQRRDPDLDADAEQPAAAPAHPRRHEPDARLLTERPADRVRPPRRDLGDGCRQPRSARDRKRAPGERRVAELVARQSPEAFSRNYQVLAMNATGGGRHYVTRAVPGDDQRAAGVVTVRRALCAAAALLLLAPAASAGAGRWLSWNAAARTASLTLVAGYNGANNGFNFDGYGRGRLLVQVPGRGSPSPARTRARCATRAQSCAAR